MSNLEIRRFRESIITLTNETFLPIEIKRLVFLEVLSQLNTSADEAIRSELQREKDMKNDKNLPKLNEVESEEDYE